jgi:antitoxin CcdA
MSVIYDEGAAKKATNVTVNSDLLQKAKSYNINLSKNFEAYLAEIVKQREEEKWLEENREAIEKQNERIRKRGSFSDGIRRF